MPTSPEPAGPSVAGAPLPRAFASMPPRHWIIGDVHGCADALIALLQLLPALLAEGQHVVTEAGVQQCIG